MNQQQLKELVGERIAERVVSGEVIGIGTGSTVDCALAAIGRRIRNEGITVSAIVTSLETAQRCREFGIQCLHPLATSVLLSWGFDGTDEIDAHGRLIKGKGGAMLEEKIVAARCQKFIVLADNSKVVETLGRDTAVPIEVIPSASAYVEKEVSQLGATKTQLRSGMPGKHGPIVTERGNLILDAHFSIISDELEALLNGLPGVVENGLFIGRTDEAFIAETTGVREVTFQRRKR